MRVLKKLLVLTLTAVMTANMFGGVGYASETAKPPEVDTEAPQVIGTKTISASKCKQIYENMNGYNGWTAQIAGIVAGLIGSLGGVAGGVTGVAAIIQQINYNSAKKEFKAGWKSGKGCKMIIYDNTVPCVLAL